RGGGSEMAWSPDSKTLALAGGDNSDSIYLWDVATGKCVCRLKAGNDHGICSLAWSPDSKTLASAGFDGVARLWDVATGKETQRLIGHMDPVLALAWSSDGKRVATGRCRDGTVRLWDATTGTEISCFGEDDRRGSVVWSADRTTLEWRARADNLR